MRISGWQWFPVGLIAAMGVVFAVNVAMVYDAYQSFPGVAGADGFDLSNQYKRVLATAQHQADLGWQVQAEVPAGQPPALRLTNHDATPLNATVITAQAERPVGPAATTVLAFRQVADGRYQADTALAPGQWDLMLTILADGQQYAATRRVIVK